MTTFHRMMRFIRDVPEEGYPLRPPLPISLPALFVALLMLLPLLYLLIRASAIDLPILLSLFSTRVLTVLGNSLVLALAVTLSAVVIAVPLAWLTTVSDLPGRKFWAVATTLPLVIPSYVGAYALVAALGPRGLASRLIAPLLGLERLPHIYGFPGAWLALTLFSYPYVLLTVRAALRGLDPRLEEAARGLGDAPLLAFFRVTLPQLRPAILSGALLSALYVLSDFGAVSMLQYTTFTRAIYVQYSASINRFAAAALALALVAITLILIYVEQRVRLRAARLSRPQVRTTGKVTLPLGRWKVPGLLACGGVTLLGVGIPAIVTLTWLALGLSSGEAFAVNIGGPTWRSLLAGGLAALAAVVAAAPIAFLASRYRGRFSRYVERTAYIGNALPGVVIGLSLVFFGITFAYPLYQTLGMLIFAYVVRYLPLAITGLRTSVDRISPRLEEAGRGLGGKPPRILWTITLPLMRPGLFAGGALVFLSTMKELPATLMLAPIEYSTLATGIWSTTVDAFYGRAAPLVLILLAVSALSIGLVIERER